MAAVVPLLTPVALTELVRKIPAGPLQILTNRVRKTPNPLPVVEWDVYRPNHGAANFSYPGEEAEIVDQTGRSHMSATLAYLRLKKVFDPVTLYFVRELGGLGLQRAAEAVAREVENLNERIDNRVELALWGALAGSASLPYRDGTTKTVDYGFAADHKVTLSGADPVTGVWTGTTKNYTAMIADVRAAKYKVEVDGRVPVTDAFLTAKTMDLVFDAAARPTVVTSPGNLVTTQGGGLLSDRMKDQYYQTGTLPGFMGMNWTVVPVTNLYDDANGAPAAVVPDNKVFFANLDNGNPIELREGPTADLSNAQGTIGKFSKSWKEEDPSAEQFLIEYSFLPIVTRPEQFYTLVVG